MGPITPNEGSNEGRQRAIKWIDNDEEPTQGPKLVTSKSGDDLNLKENVQPIETHKKQATQKSTIKNFKLDLNHLTGIPNFAEISKEPLKIPQYALDIAAAASQ